MSKFMTDVLGGMVFILPCFCISRQSRLSLGLSLFLSPTSCLLFHALLLRNYPAVITQTKIPLVSRAHKNFKINFYSPLTHFLFAPFLVFSTLPLFFLHISFLRLHCLSLSCLCVRVFLLSTISFISLITLIHIFFISLKRRHLNKHPSTQKRFLVD